MFPNPMLNCCLGSAQLNLDTGATTHDIAQAFEYAIGGEIKTKATTSNTATPTTDVNDGVAFPALAASQGVQLIFCLNLAGTVGVAQSAIRDLDTDDSWIEGIPDFPQVPDGYIPFATVVIKATSTASAFTVGTSNWDATGIETDVENHTVLPDRPRDDATA